MSQKQGLRGCVLRQRLKSPFFLQFGREETGKPRWKLAQERCATSCFNTQRLIAQSASKTTD